MAHVWAVAKASAKFLNFEDDEDGFREFVMKDAIQDPWCIVRDHMMTHGGPRGLVVIERALRAIDDQDPAYLPVLYHRDSLDFFDGWSKEDFYVFFVCQVFYNLTGPGEIWEGSTDEDRPEMVEAALGVLKFLRLDRSRRNNKANMAERRASEKRTGSVRSSNPASKISRTGKPFKVQKRGREDDSLATSPKQGRREAIDNRIDLQGRTSAKQDHREHEEPARPSKKTSVFIDLTLPRKAEKRKMKQELLEQELQGEENKSVLRQKLLEELGLEED